MPDCLNSHLYKAVVIKAGHSSPPLNQHPQQHLLQMYLFSFIHNTTVKKEVLEPLWLLVQATEEKRKSEECKKSIFTR